tara:strand:+ start:232 stop:618 length:387 start_codon:yes stop_codon:yes gene_type:complete
VFDPQAAAAKAASQSQKRPSPVGMSDGCSGSPESDVTMHGDGGGQVSAEELPPTKRARILKRTKLTEEQISILSAAFVSNPMPDTFKRQLPAAHLGLTHTAMRARLVPKSAAAPEDGRAEASAPRRPV